MKKVNLLVLCEKCPPDPQFADLNYPDQDCHNRFMAITHREYCLDRFRAVFKCENCKEAVIIHGADFLDDLKDLTRGNQK